MFGLVVVCCQLRGGRKEELEKSKEERGNRGVGGSGLSAGAREQSDFSFYSAGDWQADPESKIEDQKSKIAN